MKNWPIDKKHFLLPGGSTQAWGLFHCFNQNRETRTPRIPGLWKGEILLDSTSCLATALFGTTGRSPASTRETSQGFLDV